MVGGGSGSHSLPRMAEAMLLADFLGSEALPLVLRRRVVTHAKQAEAIRGRDWLPVLEGLRKDPAARDLVVDIVHGSGDSTLAGWAAEAASRADTPLATRALLDPKAVVGEVTAALLRGEALPCDAVRAVGGLELWPRVLEAGAHLTAAVLATLGPVPDHPDLDRFLHTGLVHTKKAHRHAAVEVLQARGGEVALLALLAECQPLHLLEAVRVDPEPAFHDAAALLASRYGDPRVVNHVLGRVRASDRVILQLECPRSTAWQQAASGALLGLTSDDVVPLLEGNACLRSVLAAWAEAAPAGSPSALRALRRLAPEDLDIHVPLYTVCTYNIHIVYTIIRIHIHIHAHIHMPEAAAAVAAGADCADPALALAAVLCGRKV